VNALLYRFNEEKMVEFIAHHPEISCHLPKAIYGQGLMVLQRKIISWGPGKL
jgi:hypothetical protein